MNKRQRLLFFKLLVIVVLTMVFITGMTWYKDIVNKREGVRAMNIVSLEIARYRDTVGSLPPMAYIEQIIDKRGLVRLGSLDYRARWIDFTSPGDTILLSSKRSYKTPLVESGYIFLRLSDIEEAEKVVSLREEILRLQKRLKDSSDSERAEMVSYIQDVQSKLSKLQEENKMGQCEWMPKEQFEELLRKQQSEAEFEIYIKTHQNGLKI